MAGPTGVGKTLFAVELALRFDGEIIGADAYQVYAGLEVLTSQPSAELRSRVPHHLVGFLSPSEKFDAATFRQLAQACIADIQSRGRRPILVGGSGMYLKALTHGIVELPDPDPALRAEVRSLSREESLRQLLALDPEASQHIDLQNTRRIQRVLEIVLQTGKKSGDLNQEWKEKDAPGYKGLLLLRDREELRERIATTVRSMLAQGAIEEVQRVENPSLTAQMAIGFRDIQALLRGECSREECEAAIIKSTQRYAKRQLTWFRNQFTFPSVDLTGLRTTQEFLTIARHSLGATE